MKRRDVLKGAGVLAGSALLNRCGGGSGKIDTVIYVMMENRSFDHLLGARALVEGLPVDGLTAQMSNPDSGGNVIAPFAAPSSALCVPDPPHGWDASHAQFDSGKLDGFVQQQQDINPGDTNVMQYLTRTDEPVTWSLADNYAICERWFASVMGPTWPNRFYFLSGTSSGQTDNITPVHYPAPTIFGRLDSVNVPYRIYYSDFPFATLMGQADFDFEKHISPISQFFTDAAAGQLPSVVYLDPPFTAGDDHPPHHPILGQQFIASIYNALAQSPHWERSLMLLTYDEHGGFFDHVAPPQCEDDYAAQGFNQLGFRVPAILIGPYVKQGHVSSVVRNHASALKHLEGMFGFAPLTKRTSTAVDLSEMLDLDRLSRGEPAKPAAIPAVNVDDWTLADACNVGGLARSPHDVLRIASTHPLTQRFDRSGEIRETLALFDRWAR